MYKTTESNILSEVRERLRIDLHSHFTMRTLIHKQQSSARVYAVRIDFFIRTDTRTEVDPVPKRVYQPGGLVYSAVNYDIQTHLRDHSILDLIGRQGRAAGIHEVSSPFQHLESIFHSSGNGIRDYPIREIREYPVHSAVPNEAHDRQTTTDSPGFQNWADAAATLLDLPEAHRKNLLSLNKGCVLVVLPHGEAHFARISHSPHRIAVEIGRRRSGHRLDLDVKCLDRDDTWKNTYFGPVDGNTWASDLPHDARGIQLTLQTGGHLVDFVEKSPQKNTWIGSENPWADNRPWFEAGGSTGAAQVAGPAKKVAARKSAKAKIFETTFATYTMVKQLGQGGCGRVYLVKNSDDEEFALKLLTNADNAEHRKRFKNEIYFCSKNQHANIVSVHDHGLHHEGGKKLPFYVMAVFARSLHELMKAGISHDRVLPFFSQVLSGLEAAHLLKVVHRDIKPKNILLDKSNDRLAVADFGIAHFAEEDLATLIKTKPGAKMANYMYAAPEQKVPGRAVDHRCDIFALGLLLNEMFTGEVIHGTGSRRVADAAPEYAYLDEIVDMMIQQDPAKRPASIAEVKRLLIAHGAQPEKRDARGAQSVDV